MKRIFSRIVAGLEQGDSLMLVSVVANQGSAPRGAGARMLVGPSGRIVGTIGGGAVELRSETLALELLEEGRSAIHDFRLHRNATEDIGMVCGGDVTVLFRYIPGDSREWLALAEAVLDRLEAHTGGWLLDPLTEDNVLPCLYTPEQSWGGPAPDQHVLEQMWGNAPRLADGWFGEPLPIGERVVIFGGGHIAQELVPVLRHLGFRPVVFEDRQEYARPELFPGAEQTILGDFSRVADSLTLNEEDYVVIMTSGHKNDYEVEGQILALPHAYLGVIGSPAKTAAVNQRLLADGFTQEQLDQVYTPIGVKIKSETPAEIAISIAGELILVRAERRGGPGGGCPMH